MASKTTHLTSFIGEVTLKVIVVQAEKIKAKVYVNEHDFLLHIKLPTR
jgi:hypothetical protein